MKIKLPTLDKHIFNTNIQIRIDDINYGNHLGNDKLLTYAHEARVQFLNSLGHNEINIFGKGIIMSESAVNYLAEGFYGQILDVKIGIEQQTPITLDLIYVFTHQEKKVALVYTKLVSFDYENRKTIPFHTDFLTQLSKL